MKLYLTCNIRRNQNGPYAKWGVYSIEKAVRSTEVQTPVHSIPPQSELKGCLGMPMGLFHFKAHILWSPYLKIDYVAVYYLFLSQ